jgi:predicted dehydrogenase
MDGHDQSADSVYFNAAFPTGVHGSFNTSWISSQGNRNQTIELSFYGSDGALQLLSSKLGIQLKYARGKESWQEMDVEGVIKWDDKAKPSEERFRPWRLTDRNEIWKWVDLILERKSGRSERSTVIPTFRDGYSVQKVIDAVIQSAVLKKEVCVGELTKPNNE